MTLTEALARVEKEIDTRLQEAEVSNEDLLRTLGATDEDVEATLQHERARCTEWKATEMERLSGWLRRGGNSEH